jgi:hypothetical protein
MCIAKPEKIGERWNQSLVSFPSLDTPATAARLGRFFVRLGIQGVDSQFQRYELVESMDLGCRI